MIFEERARDRTIFLQVCDPCSFEIFDYVRKKIIYKKPWIRLFDPFSISLRGFIFGKSSISSKKKIVCSKSKFSFLCKRYNRFLHDSFYKKNNFIDSNSNCLFQNTFVPLRSIKIQNYTYPFSHNVRKRKREREILVYQFVFTDLTSVRQMRVTRRWRGWRFEGNSRNFEWRFDELLLRKSAESRKRGGGKKKEKNSSTRRRAVIPKSFSEFISKWPLWYFTEIVKAPVSGNESLHGQRYRKEYQFEIPKYCLLSVSNIRRLKWIMEQE